MMCLNLNPKCHKIKQMTKKFVYFSKVSADTTTTKKNEFLSNNNATSQRSKQFIYLLKNRSIFIYN
jgi:hypothetical protein